MPRLNIRRSIARIVFAGCLSAASLVAIGAAHAQSLEEGFSAWRDGDYPMALREWQPLAEEGDVDAQSAVGFMYFNGQGVPQDYLQAFAWYRRAARQGNALAQNNLALMYANGNGVRRDDVRALMWFNLAAANMESDAARTQAAANRDQLARQMTKAQIDEGLAMAWRCQQTKLQECD